MLAVFLTGGVGLFFIAVLSGMASGYFQAGRPKGNYELLRAKQFELIGKSIHGRAFQPQIEPVDPLEAAYQDVMSMSMGPRDVEAWDPYERELFGVNDTDYFIAETDRILKGIEWDRIEQDAIVVSTDDRPVYQVKAWGDDRVIRTYTHPMDNMAPRKKVAS